MLAAREQLRQGRFAEAEALVAAELARCDSNDSPELLYLLAVAQRYQQKLDAALATQGALINAGSNFARIYQERGHTLLEMNRLADAQRAYEKAVNLNPALVASWKALLNLYALHDGELNSVVERHQARAKAELEYLLGLPGELLTVNSYLHEGKLYEADRLCRHFLRTNKTHVEGMRLLADIGQRVGVLTDAEFLLETALELAPGNLRLRYDHANLMLRMQKFEKALEQTQHLVKAEPDNLAYSALLGNAQAGVGDYEEAIRSYDRVIASSPGQQNLLVMRGHAQKTIGQLAAAIGSYQQAYDLKPDYGDAYWSLANTKSYRFSDAELAQMQAQEAAGTTDADDRVHLCFALGKAFEDRAEHEASFVYYDRGNRLQREASKHQAEFVARRAQAQKRYCTESLFTSRFDVGADDPAPIFVLGLPRAGSTLIEQILASHSQVDGTLELPNVISLVQRLRGAGRDAEPRYPKILTELEPEYFRRFGEQYIRDTQVYRKDAPFFVDKNPNNFFHIGLIKLMLPNAKVIDARRHPMSCCFSNFKQLFGQGQEFTYGLEEIGHYYREYVGLMQHWDAVLPGFVLRLQHEVLVDDLEGQVRRLLEFCRLPFEQSCVDFHRTERSVRTPSSEQVRQPIFRDSLKAWKDYEPWLDPLKQALGPELCAEFEVSAPVGVDA